MSKAVKQIRRGGERPGGPRTMRRLATVALSAGALASAVAACGGSSKSSSSSPASGGSSGGGTTSVKIDYTAPVADQMLASVTASAGIFTKNGVNADVNFLAPTAILQALVAGQIQFAVIGAPAAEIAAVNGSPLEYVGQWEHAIDSQIVADKSVGSVKDMNGKTIAISTTGALSDFLVQVANDRYGVTMHEVPLGSFPNEITAYDHGSVNAVSGTNPWQLSSLKAQSPGSHVIVDFRKDTGYVGVGLVVDQKWADQNRATVVKVLKALGQGLTYYKSHAAQSIAVIAKDTEEPKTEATQAYTTTKAAFTSGLIPTLGDQKHVLTALIPSQPKAKGFDASKRMDASFAKQAQGS